MRVIDVHSKELRCGGRLVKRLRNESDYLTTGYLDDLQDRAFVGTSGGDIIILDIAANPPRFLHQLELGTAIAKLCICLDTLLVAHGDSVTVFKLEEKSMERRIQRQRFHRSKFLHADEAEIQAVTTTPDGRLIFGGYSDGSVAIWTSQQQEAYVILQAHSDAAKQLVWVDSHPWGPALLSGGGDGKVITWSLGNTDEDYAFWSPNGDLDSGAFNTNWSQVGGGPAAAAASESLSAFEPSFSTTARVASAGNDVFAMNIGNPRTNLAALKRDDESDSDNDIVGAFR
jgi:WD40 repeat protein